MQQLAHILNRSLSSTVNLVVNRTDRLWNARELGESAASECESFITRENIVLDGGLTVSLPMSLLNEVCQTDEQPSHE